MKRRAFILKVGGLLFVSPIALKIVACGSDDEKGACAKGASASAISGNHGHALTLTITDLSASTPESFSIQGTSEHTHDIDLTVAEMSAILSGMSVTVGTTQNAAHDHMVTISCG